MVRWIISISGIVQGVGFRPFVFRLAGRHDLRGSVINTPDGVEIDVEGEQDAIDKFLVELRSETPDLAKIDDVRLEQGYPAGYSGFVIGETQRTGSAKALISADVCVCPDCLKELFAPGDRRYRYPFINCTNCGPRFTIIRDVPYDREYTTMRVFPMCPECSTEYHDPADRRFHAQPNACPGCGPKVVLRDSSGGLMDDLNPVTEAARLLQKGYILGVKGLGGYHLACSALDQEAVSSLRERKVREDKPFAVMVRDIRQAEEFCQVSVAEAGLLLTPKRPIVLLKKGHRPVASQLAPGNAYLGVMLPYTPLHYLLFDLIDFPLVMTSGNMSDEPMAFEDNDALMRLGQIADCFLTHNRDISHRCDDSVTRLYRGREYPLRRSRGYAPAPIRVSSGDLGQVLAVGGEQKNTFCLTKGDYAFVSHHIGDLENLETLEAFEREIGIYKKLFYVEPEIVAYDLHPEYLSTKYAMDLAGVVKTGVQHHHAHIAACMAEHGLKGSVLGVAFDGTGFGPDGSIWGGEFMYASLTQYERMGHLQYTPMPGGAKAIREPWRMACGYLFRQYGADWRNKKEVGFLTEKNGMVLDALGEAMDKWINCPLTSSMGRLFDAMAALLGIRGMVNYEGQAAVEMEQIALTAKDVVNISYSYVINNLNGVLEINTDHMINEVLADLHRGEQPSRMAFKFHVTVKNMVIEICVRAREQFGENRVCLSGGVFQNMLLLDMVHSSLVQKGFDVYVHSAVPTNDGGISLGQAVIAAERRKAGCV